jgi:hypothetical protein
MPTLAARKLSIGAFAAELRRFPEAAFTPTGQILRFMENTLVEPETLAPYLHWDRQHYTRNLIDKTPSYELIAICWEAGQVSSVHNRARRQWQQLSKEFLPQSELPQKFPANFAPPISSAILRLAAGALRFPPLRSG